MVLHQLKIILNTSIPEESKPLELTSEILEYNVPSGKGKIPLSKYPYFDPRAVYPRTLIQGFPYYKKLQVFFNENKFKQIVVQSSEQMKKKGGPDVPDVEDFDDLRNTDTYNTYLMNSNFEFTIQTILSTGFPVDNYFQSMEYYDPQIRSKMFTMKGSNPSFFSGLLPSRFDPHFSYIKWNKSDYTVTKVIWINDVLNHPRYSSILDSYQITDDVKDKDKEKMQKKLKKIDENIELEYDLFILKIVLYKNRFQYKALSDSETYRDEYRIRRKLNNAMTKIVSDNKEIINVMYNGINVDESNLPKQLQSQYKMKKKAYSKDKEHDANYWLFSTILKNKSSLQTNFKGFFEMFDGKKETIRSSIDQELMPYFTNMGAYSKVKQYLGSAGVDNQEDIMMFTRKIVELRIQEKAIRYREDNTDYTDDYDNKEIKKYLETNFKDYDSVSSALIKLSKEVDIINPYWQKELLKYQNLEYGKVDVTDTDTNSLLDVISKCKVDNSLCKRENQIPNAHLYLTVGLDQLRNTKDFNKRNVLEAYLQVDVIKGKVTPENSNKLFCTFSDHMLGYLIKKESENSSENYMLRKKFYMDLSSQIDSLKKDQSTKTENTKSTAKRKTKGNAKNPKNSTRKARSPLKEKKEKKEKKKKKKRGSSSNLKLNLKPKPLPK